MKDSNTKCMFCGTEIDFNDDYCHECGNSLKNFCSNNDCAKNVMGDEKYEIDYNDKYCRECGSISTLYKLYKNQQDSSDHTLDKI